MKKKIGLIVLALFSCIILSACGSNKLKGSYTGNVKVLLMETKSTLTFEDDTVTEKQDGEVINKGTYEISDNKLEMKIGDYNMTADLSEDRKSFTITSAEGLVGLANGTKYTKEEE